MFKWINSQRVQCDSGFVVESMGRFTIAYRGGSKKIGVCVENGLTNDGQACVIIESSAFVRWDGDPSYAQLPAEKQDEMLANFTAAMEFQGIAVLVT